MQKTRLFIFPHAGGSDISYSSIEKSISHCFDASTICYPGRGRRYSENFVKNINELIDDCLAQLLSKLNGSVFFFMGHSFGALVAFECARALQQNKMEVPPIMFLSGRGSPAYTSLSAQKHKLNDTHLTNYLKTIGGLPDALLADTSFLSFYLPIIRNDLALNENYTYKNSPLIHTKLVLINGTADTVVSPESVKAWQQETEAGCKFEMLEGGHFFHLENPLFTDMLFSYNQQYIQHQLNCLEHSNL